MNIQALFAAQKKVENFGDRGESTAIYKSPIQHAEVDINGITTDIQANRKLHGGSEKALHQYAPSNYALLAQLLPDLKEQFVVGCIGENIACDEMHDSNVHIGDIYRLGGVLVQVSQPRQPCWKINEKFQNKHMLKLILEHSISGWYYRVLEPGQFAVGDEITLEERLNDLSTQKFSTMYFDKTLSKEDVVRLYSCKGLNQDWVDTLKKRANR